MPKPKKTEGQIAYEAAIAKQRSGSCGAHSMTWPAWEKLTDAARAQWEDPSFRARAEVPSIGARIGERIR